MGCCVSHRGFLVLMVLVLKYWKWLQVKTMAWGLLIYEEKTQQYGGDESRVPEVKA